MLTYVIRLFYHVVYNNFIYLYFLKWFYGFNLIGRLDIHLSRVPIPVDFEF